MGLGGLEDPTMGFDGGFGEKTVSIGEDGGSDGDDS